MTDYRCHSAGRTQPRMLATHQPDCDRDTCRGCQPCPERHCRVCGHEHVTSDTRGTDQTCGPCLSETRTNLATIGTYAAQLLGEAIVRGIQSQAAVLAGPAADPETWNRRAILAARAATYADAHSREHRTLAAFTEDNGDDPHPTWIVGTWEMLVREHLDQPTDEKLTLTAARAYLDGHLTRLAHDPDFGFEDLARDLDRCRTHLETVLHDGEQIERGAPCQRCDRPLERHTDETGRVSFECPHCHDVLTENQYRLAVRADHMAYADRLNVDDMAERTGVSASSIRTWANERKTQRVGEDPVVHPPLLRSCGVDSRGRKVYRVSEVERIRDAGGDTRGRKRAAAGTDRAQSGTVGNEGAA